MLRLLSLLLFCACASVQAATTLDPAVFTALQRAQAAQQQGDYGAARKLLAAAQAKSGSSEEAFLWRSRGYLAWAEGDSRTAFDWLEKAVASGRLEEPMLAEDRLNLARLGLDAGRYGKVIELLAKVAPADEQVLRMQVQAYQGLGQHAKALPLAERYLKANPRADDAWLQLLVAGHAQLKQYQAAERWQRRLLERHPGQGKLWRQLASLQQMAGQADQALATLRTAYVKGLRFSEAELDNLVALASNAGQPWQGARLLEGMLQARLLAASATRQERLATLWWQARERGNAASLYRQLASQSGNPKFWMNVAQLELEQAHWQAGLEALRQAERAGAERRRVRQWREWAESEMSFERDRQVARLD